MPSDFACIWAKSVTTSLDISNIRHKNESRIEKLFMLNPRKYGISLIDK